MQQRFPLCSCPNDRKGRGISYCYPRYSKRQQFSPAAARRARKSLSTLLAEEKRLHPCLVAGGDKHSSIYVHPPRTPHTMCMYTSSKEGEHVRVSSPPETACSKLARSRQPRTVTKNTHEGYAIPVIVQRHGLAGVRTRVHAYVVDRETHTPIRKCVGATKTWNGGGKERERVRACRRSRKDHQPTSGRAVLRPRDRGTKKTFPFS